MVVDPEVVGLIEIVSVDLGVDLIEISSVDPRVDLIEIVLQSVVVVDPGVDLIEIVSGLGGLPASFSFSRTFAVWLFIEPTSASASLASSFGSRLQSKPPVRSPAGTALTALCIFKVSMSIDR